MLQQMLQQMQQQQQQQQQLAAANTAWPFCVLVSSLCYYTFVGVSFYIPCVYSVSPQQQQHQQQQQ